MSKSTKKLVLLFILPSILLITALILNLTSYTPLFNLNLNTIPKWQNNQILGSQGFLVFMNIISNLLNPVLCAVYILAFYLISYRKVEILVFMVWFVWLSFLLGILKEVVGQPRPFWVEGQVRMLEWICYSEYGCPSGHSMMAIILMEFIVRFYARVNGFVKKWIVMFYVIIFVVQMLVMLSRVLLGMHSFNQVLMGLMVGAYSFIPYYLYCQKWILSLLLSMSKTQHKQKAMLFILTLILISFAIQLSLVFGPDYDNSRQWAKIKSFPQCNGVLQSRSFHYRCFQDSAILMVAFSVMFCFVVLKKPQNLVKVYSGSRMSGKYKLRLFVMVIMAAIPTALFLNPLWHKLELDNSNMSTLIWSTQTLAFFLIPIFLIDIASRITIKLKLQNYDTPAHYHQFIQYQTFIRSKKTTSVDLRTQMVENTIMEGQGQKRCCF